MESTNVMENRCILAHEMRESGNYKLKDIAMHFGVSSTRAAAMASQGRRIKGRKENTWHKNNISGNGVSAVEMLGYGSHGFLTEQEIGEIKKRLIGIVHGKEKIKGVGKITVAEVCQFFGVEYVKINNKKEQEAITYLERRGYEVKRVK